MPVRTSVALSRFNTRFASLFDKGDGSAWQARHGMTAEAYQTMFDLLVRQGYRLTYVTATAKGRDRGTTRSGNFATVLRGRHDMG